ncbi:MAG: nucleotidyl transferase AbiEii/AbiGii toxin family protein [Solirubrobacteraceae bacterium]
MKYATPEAFRAALDQRIRNQASTIGVPLMRLRKRVAFERFLARVAATDPQIWVLKGAYALELRLGELTRATRDIDLSGAVDEPTATASLLVVQTIDLQDYFSFDIARTAALDAAEDLRAIRYSVTAELAGRRFEQFPVDVALGEQPTVAAERLSVTSLVGFAEIPPTEVPVIALEQHIAEKLHAYTSTYGPQQQPSTRVKDLIDLVLIADHSSPNAERLRANLRSTFSARDRQPLPTKLPEPPRPWAAPYARAADEVGLPTSLILAHADAAAFLDPILAGTATGDWNPRRHGWPTR